MVKLTNENRCEILLLHERKTPIAIFARKFEVSRPTVYKVINTWNNEHRITPLKTAEKKSTISETTVKKIVEFVKRNNRAELKTIKRLFKLPLSIQRISQILIANGLKSRVGFKRQTLTQKAKDERLDFARKHLDFDFKKVVFTDEKTVQNYQSGPISIRRSRGTRYNEENIVKADCTRKFKVCK